MAKIITKSNVLLSQTLSYPMFPESTSFHATKGLPYSYPRLRIRISLQAKVGEQNQLESEISVPMQGRYFQGTASFANVLKKRVKGKSIPCRLLCTKGAEEKIKRAAEDKDDKNLLLQIRDVDLIAKELQMHDSCYNNYTRVASEREVEVTENRGNFDAVKEFIHENILLLNQAVSIAKIHEIYGDGNSKDTRYRHKLKQKIEECFGDDIRFLTIDKVTPQIVINAKSLNETAIVRSREVIVNLAAEYLKEDIQSYAERTPELSWPPSVTDLERQEKDMPCSVEKILRNTSLLS